MRYELLEKPDFTMVKVVFDQQGEQMTTESSAMVARDSKIDMKTQMQGGFLAAAKRKLLGGESVFQNTFTATAPGQSLYFAPAPEGDVVAVEMDGQTPILMNSGCFLGAAPTVTLDTKWGGTKGFFSGSSFFLLRAMGTGPLFFASYGGIHAVDVGPGGYVCDTGHVVAFTGGLNYNVQRLGGLKSMFFSGEGLVCNFQGQGRLWISTRNPGGLVGFVNPFRPVQRSNLIRSARVLVGAAVAALTGTVLVLAGTAGVAAAQSRIDLRTETIARVIASGGIGGRFATPVCRRGRTLAPADTALYTYALEREALAPDAPMILDTGGLLAPHGVARYAAETDPDALAELVHALGYRALALGIAELGAPRESMLEVLRALRERRIPALATNLRCEGEAAPLCEVVVDASDGPSMHTVAGRSMAVLAFLPSDASSRVAPDRAAGVSIEAIDRAMPRAVRRARERGASIVVAVAALDGAAALALAQALPEDARPDLVLLAGTADLLFARPATVVPAIASPPSGDAIEVLVREGLLRAGYEMVAQPLGGRGIDVGTPVHDLVSRVGGAYCAAWGATLPGGTLERPLDPRGLAELGARIVQLEAEADVAIVNLSAIDSHWRPARGDALTESDLYVALEHDEPLLVAEVPSAWITEVARRTDAHRLITPGLSWDGSTARVLERPLQPRARYRVVTLRFLASGGDQALPPLPDGISWRLVEQGTLRSVVLDSLRARSHDDARDALADPRIVPEWIAQGTIDGTFSGSSIENPAGYDSALLNRGSTLALGLEVNLRADATAPTWSWENVGVLRYRAQWLPSTVPGTSGAFTEAVDQLQVQSLGAWRGLRQQPGDWFVPDPFVEVFFESELTEPAVRPWHWMLLRPMIGARFPLTAELEVKLFTGFQAQLLQPESEAEFGVGSTITLRPWDLARIEDRHVTVQALVDYFLVDLGDENRWQLRASFDGSFDLAGPLALTLGVRAYVQQDRGQDVGVALDATAGFRLGWLGRAVGP